MKFADSSVSLFRIKSTGQVCEGQSENNGITKRLNEMAKLRNQMTESYEGRLTNRFWYAKRQSDG